MALVRWGLIAGWCLSAIVPGEVGSLSLWRAVICELAEAALAYEGLDLIFEVNTLVGGMTMVLVEAAVFGLIFSSGRVS